MLVVIGSDILPIGYDRDRQALSKWTIQEPNLIVLALEISALRRAEAFLYLFLQPQLWINTYQF